MRSDSSGLILPNAVKTTSLTEARILCHEACQWLSRAARANLTPMPDDSHSNLGWSVSYGALASHPLSPDIQMAFRFDDPALLFVRDESIEAVLDLEGESVTSVRDWADGRLADFGLRSTVGVQMPYVLDDIGDYARVPELAIQIALVGEWFAAAHTVLLSCVWSHAG